MKIGVLPISTKKCIDSAEAGNRHQIFPWNIWVSSVERSAVRVLFEIRIMV